MHQPPIHIVPFFGRTTDVNRLIQLLADDKCRLITIAGPGGIGKTRLAEQIAIRAVDIFENGCQWISLHTLTSAELLLPAVVDSLGLTLNSDPIEQLSRYLQHKNMLLIFDNFEHLLDSGPVLTELLAVAPHVKILVTSREILNLHEEWIHHLDGLLYPSADDRENAGQYPAVDLFVNSARRVSSSLDVEHEMDAITRICQHVNGMPLALELAAGWTHSLTCAEIAEEIETGLDLLTTRARNIPERHRSIRVVFEHTCSMLTSTEYDIFKRLSVFCGGFHRDAAEQIAGATVSILATLIEKSLLKHGESDRYYLHELVRQYAEEQLRGIPDEVVAYLQRHSDYYMRLLHRCENDIMGAGQKSAIRVIEADLDNIRFAWVWALQHGKFEWIQQAATTLAEYCQIQSKFAEAARLFESAARALNEATDTQQTLETQVLVQAYQSGFYIRVGRLHEAEEVLMACADNYEQLGIPPVAGFATDPAFNLGILALTQGDYDSAFDYGARMRDMAELHHHQFNRQLAYHLLAEASIGQGDYQQAAKYARSSLKLLNQAGNSWFMAYAYNQLGIISFALEDYDIAQQHFEASYQIREEFNDPEGMALALRHIGNIRFRLGYYDDARERLEKSQTLYHEISDRGGYAEVLIDLALLDHATGKLESALQRHRDGLEIAAEIQFISLIYTSLLHLGELLLDVDDTETGIRILDVLSQQPTLAPKHSETIKDIVEKYDIHLPSDSDINLELIVSDLLLDFPQLSTAADSPAPATIPKFKQTLIEPLTEREQEVLHYIGQGLSNREIAEKIFVSVSTVKTHINNLYGKLGVSAREEAVEAARDLHLL